MRTSLKLGFGFLITILLTGWGVWAVCRPRVAHVYIELASSPALLQMIDAVQQPADEPKFFLWKRFEALPADSPVLKSLNAVWPNAKFLGEHNYDRFIAFSDEMLATFYNGHKDYQFIVHLNLSAYPWSGHVFDIIPLDQVREIHLYEDSLGRTSWDRVSWEVWDKFTRLYKPATLHIAFDDDVIPIDKDRIVFYNFQALANQLSSSQREQVARLAGITPEFEAQISAGDTVAFADDPSLDFQRAKAFMDWMRADTVLKNSVCLYKGHPRVPKPGDNLALLEQYCAKVIVVPNFVPMEALFFSASAPKKIAGYGSSVFFSFADDQILGYIERPKNLETYIESLIKFGILSPDKIFR